MPSHDWATQRAALRALVFDRPVEICGGPELFARTDFAQVRRTALRLRSDMLARHRRGAGPLVETFAGSLAGLSADNTSERFARSRWLAEYGEMPDTADQMCAEEAFYRFLCDEGIGDSAVRLAEFVDAMIVALAVQPVPAFAIPREIERAPFGYFAIVDAAVGKRLFAAVGNRVVRGPVASRDAALRLLASSCVARP